MSSDAPIGSPALRSGPIAILAILAVGLLAYANTFDAEFVWDDASSVLLHEHVQNPANLAALYTEDQHTFGRGQGNFYRPLLATTFMLDFALAYPGRPSAAELPVVTGYSPFVFHLHSVAWHIAAALLLFALMRRLRAPEILQCAVPLIYVLHPLHTEAVAYVSGRADSMSAALMFAGLCIVTRTETARQRTLAVVLCPVLFAAALLSKESSLIFPALLALTILATRHSKGDEDPAPARALTRWAPLASSLVVLGLYVALRMTALNFAPDAASTAKPIAARLSDTVQAFAIYLGLVFKPTQLHMERSLDGVSPWTGILGALLLAGMLYTLWRCYRAGLHRAAFGLSWFLITWLPIAGIFPLNAPLAEHWMYVPLAGLLWALGEILLALSLRIPAAQRTPALAVVAGFVFVAWALALLNTTVQRNRAWHDNETLYTATLRENPNSLRVQFNLAVTYEDLLGNPVGAKRHYENVLALFAQRRAADPQLEGHRWAQETEAHLSLGRLNLAQRRYNEAAAHYSQVLASSPSGDEAVLMNAAAAYGLGRCYLAIGDRQNAMLQFQNAVQARPDLQDPINRLLLGEFIPG